MAGVRVLSTMGVTGVMQALGPAFEAAQGVRIDAEFLPTVRLLERIRAGERGDVAILTADAVDALEAEGVLEGRVDLARSFVAVAVRAGTPHPDISSREAFVATLLRARSVAMSQAGASGIFMAALLERLGIAAAMREKSVIPASGYTASLAASGEVELAIQQESELRMVDGIEIVGRLPAELGGETVFSAGLFRGAAMAAAGRALIGFLRDPAQGELYRERGLMQAGTAASTQA